MKYLELDSVKLVEDSILSQRIKYIINTLFNGYDKDDFYPFKSKKKHKINNDNIIDYVIEVKNINLLSLDRKFYEIESRAIKLRNKYNTSILYRIKVYKNPPYVIVEFSLVEP